MSKWQIEKAYCNTPKGFGWAIYMKDQNTEYTNPDGDNLIFDTQKEAKAFIVLLNIIDEAEKLGREFTLADAQDVLDTKPTWAKWTETEAEAVADYIDAFGC
jgi:hypothetical protein